MPEPDASQLDELAAEVRALIERVDDLALETLREAAATGATERPRLERDLTRVRHALERAVVILGRQTTDEPI